MSAIDDDQDLLFGVTAVELRFVSHEQLVGATAAGGEGRAVGAARLSLRERLCQLKLISPAEADAVEAVVAQRVVRCGGDIHQTAAVIGAASVAAKSPTADEGDAPTQVDRFVTQAPRAWAYEPQRQRFTVLRMHQQGGLGRLMVARDGELNREIALKEILPAFADDQENRQRFIREAEITGALEHPGIVPVYSLGEFPDGRPYYAMRFIRGVDLRMALDDFHGGEPTSRGARELAFRQLLTRFVAVCMAIDYAHSRGVIHRDIKPGNIMLGDFGETLVVDWGIAKPLDEPTAPAGLDSAPIRPSDRASSTRTQAGRMVGTLVYMSPEQAAGRLDLVSTASDVYGLGATLYHVLTGRPPFEHGDDTAFLVQQGRFPRPRAAAKHVPKALEAICLKAMSRQAGARYESARALASDVERFLADEPVAAYPDPVVARAWRWVRRHRTPVMSGMAAAAVAIAGLAIGVGLLRVERDRAEANFRLAQQAVRDYYVQVSEETLLNHLGMQPLRDSLLRQALVYYEQFLEQRQHDPELRREVAQAQFFVGRITETVDSPSEALPFYEQAARGERELLAAAPQDVALAADHAQTLNAWGRALQKLGQLAEARTRFADAAAVREHLADASPDDAELARALASSVMNLGMVELAAGKPQDALPLLERAQSLRLAHVDAEEPPTAELQRDLGMGYYNIALVSLALGDAGDAETHLQDAITVFEQLAERVPQDFDNERRLALCLRTLGDVKAQNGDVDAAIPFYEQARDKLGRLVDRNPDVADYRADLAAVRMNLGVQLQALGDDEAALAEMDAAAEELSALVDAKSATPRHRRDLAVALRAAGELLTALKRGDEARERLGRSVEVLEELVREFPDDAAYGEELELTREALRELDSI